MTLALIAGEGRLPELVHAAGAPAVVAELIGFPSGLPGAEPFRIEHLGTLLWDLKRRGVDRVCLAGRIRRPPIDASEIDDATRILLPRLAEAMTAGDDGALRIVMALFEEAGLVVVAAHDICPALLPPPGVPTAHGPQPRDEADILRGRAVIDALGRADIGQACVVAAGQAMAVEAAGGTDWMLATLAASRPPGPAGGVLVKGPKPGQDLRADAPTVGPETVTGAARAGLSGIAVLPGTLVLDAVDVVSRADAHGLFLQVLA